MNPSDRFMKDFIPDECKRCTKCETCLNNDCMFCEKCNECINFY